MRLTMTFLIVLTLVSNVGVATQSSYRFALDPAGETIDGTWSIEAVGGTPGVQLLTTFVRGIAVANGNAARPTLRSPWQGAYVRLGYRDFATTMVRYTFDEAGNFTGRTELLYTITVDPTLNEFSGKSREYTFDADSNLTRMREGTVRAVRFGVRTID